MEYVIFGATTGRPSAMTKSRAMSGANEAGRKRTVSGASVSSSKRGTGKGSDITSYSGTGKKRISLIEGASKHRPTKAQAQEIHAIRQRMTSFLNESIDFNQM